MAAIEVAELPKDLKRGHDRFSVWRSRRSRGSRIPPSLWRLAVHLVHTYGVSRTATVLGVDYYALKRRAEASTAAAAASNTPAFVALPAPVALGKQSVFELDNGAGATMRVQLAGYEAADVEAIARGFWEAQ